MGPHTANVLIVLALVASVAWYLNKQNQDRV